MIGCEKFELAIKEFGVDAACEYFGVSVGTKLWHLFDDLRGMPPNKEIATGAFCKLMDKCMKPLDTYCEFCGNYEQRTAEF